MEETNDLKNSIGNMVDEIHKEFPDINKIEFKELFKGELDKKFPNILNTNPSNVARIWAYYWNSARLYLPAYHPKRIPKQKSNNNHKNHKDNITKGNTDNNQIPLTILAEQHNINISELFRKIIQDTNRLPDDEISISICSYFGKTPQLIRSFRNSLEKGGWKLEQTPAGWKITKPFDLIIKDIQDIKDSIVIAKKQYDDYIRKAYEQINELNHKRHDR